MIYFTYPKEISPTGRELHVVACPSGQDQKDNAPLTVVVHVVDLHLSQHKTKYTDFLADLAGYSAEVPTEHRPSMTVEFEACPDYGDSYYPVMRISYERLENVAEYEVRHDAVRKHQANEAYSRRVQFEKLRAEFEGAPLPAPSVRTIFPSESP